MAFIQIQKVGLGVGGAIRHRKIYRDNYCGISHNYLYERFKIKLDTEEYLKLIKYLQTNITNDTIDMLVNAINTKSYTELDIYIKTNNIDLAEQFPKKLPADRMLIETVQDKLHTKQLPSGLIVPTPKIPTKVKEYFYSILHHLIGKYVREYIEKNK